MKQIFFVFMSVVFLSASFAQTKYYIYFKDKGISSSTTLNKNSALYKIAESELSTRAIERRKKVMGDQDYITFEDLPISKDYIRQVESLGIKIENKLKWFNAVTSYLTSEQVNKINTLPFVSKISQVRHLNISKPESSEKINESVKSLKKIQHSLNYGYSLNQNAISEIPPVHDLGINGKDVTIGVLDSGFNWKVSSVFDSVNVLAEHDFVKGDDITANETSAENSIGQDSHGTAVLSIIGGYSSGNLIGPAYKASYILAKTEDITSEHKVEEDNYAAALEWMEGLGVDITTSSLGYTIFNPPDLSYTYSDMNGQNTTVAKAVNIAFDRGISTFTAAGNDGTVSWKYISSPADAFDILAIGAVDSNQKIANFSSYGPTSDERIKPEVCAMGVKDVHVYSGTNQFGIGDGTSFATPIAAGIGALLKSVYPHVTNQQIRKTFIECGDQVGSPDNRKGYGVISAKRVINYPNLENTGSVFKINKIFAGEEGLVSNSVLLYCRINGSEFQTVPVTYDGSLKYSAQLPSTNNANVIELFFTYTANATPVREPSNQDHYYRFLYGSLDISNLTGVEILPEVIPSQYILSQNYPNPFNPETQIEYSIPVVSGQSVVPVQLKVYDMLGREVATLVHENQSAGNYKVQFNSKVLNRTILPSGVYFYRLSAGYFVQTKKMMLIK